MKAKITNYYFEVLTHSFNVETMKIIKYLLNLENLEKTG